jgi:putative membrane protein
LAAHPAHALPERVIMKTLRTIGPVTFAVAMGLAGCGQDKPPATPDQASNTTYPPQASAPQVPPPAIVTSDNTSADVPREGPSAGSATAPEQGATERQGIAMLSDAQILEVTHTANDGEIEQAHLALKTSKDARVRKLATMMVRDHTMADNKGNVVAKKDMLTREPSPTSEVLESDVHGATQALKAQSGPDFDKGYLDDQVRQHQAVLDLLDQKLIPNAKSGDVKAYLQEVRASVASHLTHAQDLEKELQK